MVDDLLERVVEKKELRGINRVYAERMLQQWLDQHPEISEAYNADPKRFFRSKNYQKLRGEVRSQLHDAFGVFFTPQYAAKKKKTIKKFIEKPDPAHTEAVLSLHRSTQERLEYYPFLYQQLFAISGTPTRVLDIGCGFNPFSYAHLPCKPEYYFADIACDDITLIGEYFTSQNIVHKGICADMTKIENVKKLPEADVAFAFKLLDTIEDEKRGLSEEWLAAVPAKIIVVSFATMSIGQKTPIAPRAWFERLVTGRVLGTVTLPNEQLYIITNGQKEDVTQH